MSGYDFKRVNRTSARKAARSFERFARRFRLTQVDRVRYLVGASSVRPGLLLAGTALATSLYVFQPAPAVAQTLVVDGGNSPYNVPVQPGSFTDVSIGITTAGTVNVLNAGVLTGSNTVNVGGDAAGTLTVVAGGQVNAGILNIGNATATGTFTQTGGATAAATAINVGALANITLSGGTVQAGPGGTTQSGGTFVNSGGAHESSFIAVNGGTYTLSGTGVAATSNFAVNAGGALVFDGGTLRAATAGSTLSSAGTVTVNAGGVTFDTNGNDLSVGAALTDGGGGGGLTKVGAGVLTLSTGNAYTGGTALTAGTINIQDASALGTTAGGTTVASGATLQIQGGIAVGAEALSLAGTGTANNGALQNVSGANSYAGAITIAASGTRINADAGTLTLTGGINGSVANTDLTLGGAGNGAISTVGIGGNIQNLNKDGAGTWALSAANAYTGGTVINGGTLAVSGGAAIPDASTVSLGNVAGAQLSVLASETIGGLSGGGTTGGNVVITAGQTLTVTQAANTTFAGNISETAVSGAITKSGAGTLILSGTNTYSGATIVNTGGALQAGSTTAFSPTSAFTLNGTGTLTLGGFSNTIASLTSASATAVVQNASATAATLTVGDGTSTTYAGTLIDGAGGGAFGLTKQGAGTLTLSGAGNTYTGPTTINAGAITVTGGGGIGNTSAVTLANVAGAALNVTASETIASIAGGGATGGNVNIGAVTLALAGGTDAIYSGAVTGAAVGTSILSKIGGSILTLDGANTGGANFLGTANLTGGILRVNGTFGDVAGSTAIVNVNAGGQLQGTGTVRGTVNVNNGGTFAAGNSPGTITVANMVVNAGSNNVFELGQPNVAGGANNDLVNVTNNLTINGGTLTLQNAAVSGAYRLYNVGNTFTPGGGANLGFTTVTATNGTATLYTTPIPAGVPTQVNARISLGGQVVQFWDGTDFSGAGAGAQGGTATWNNTNTNWTYDAGVGTVNDSWQSQVAVFGGTAGAVTIAGTVGAQGVQFTTTGYTIAGGTLNLLGDAPGGDAAHTFFNVDTGVTATINSAITGAGVGVRTRVGGGTLQLGGASTYTGETLMDAGTNLVVLGTGSIVGTSVVTNNGTFTLNAGGTVTTAGAVTNNSGATFTTAGTLNAGSLTNNAGGTFNLAGGTTTSPTVANSGTFNSAATLNAGTSVTNNAGGTFTLTGGAVTTPNATNVGTFNQTGGTLAATAFTNAAGGTFTQGAGGTVTSLTVVNNGTHSAAGTNTATTSFTNNGTLAVTSSIATPTFTNTAVVNGLLTVTGNTTSTNTAAGTINNGINIAAAGGGATFNNAGTAGTGGLVFGNVGGTLTANNTGTFNGFANSAAGTTTTVNNSGTWTYAGTSTLAGADTISNTGTFRVASAGTLNGLETFTNAAGGRFELAANLGGTIGTFTNNAANAGSANLGSQGNGTGQGVFGGAGVFLQDRNLTGIGTFNNNGFLGAVSGAGGANNAIGAATFNNGPNGVVSLVNGRPTDTLTLTGNYNGAAGSVVALDVNLNQASRQADVIRINGQNNGQTTLVLNRLDNPASTLFSSTPVPVVVSGGGAGQVTLSQAIQGNGFVTFELEQTGGGSYQIASRLNVNAASGAAGSISALLTSLNVGFFQSVSAFIGAPSGNNNDDKTASVSVSTDPTMNWAALNKAAAAQTEVAEAPGIRPNTMSSGLWARGSGGQFTVRGTSTAVFGPTRVGAGTRVENSFAGLQVGIDTGVFNIDNTGWNLHLGVTGGSVFADGTQKIGSQTRGVFDVPFIGVYAAVTNGPFFSDINYRHDFFNAKISNQLAGLNASPLRVESNSVSGSSGYRFDFENLAGTELPYFIEPSASASYTNTSIGSLPVVGGVLQFRDIDSILGRFGLRFGTAFQATENIALQPFVTGSVWHEFAGNTVSRFVSNTIAVDPNAFVPIITDRVGTFGQVGIGVSAQVLDTPLLGYIRSDFRFGDKLEGYAVNGGVRYQF